MIYSLLSLYFCFTNPTGAAQFHIHTALVVNIYVPHRVRLYKAKNVLHNEKCGLFMSLL